MANPYGPLSAEQFQTLVDAPFGKALQTLRQYDPMWGRAPGETIRWRVTVSRLVREVGTAYVEAASEREAENLAANLDDRQINWDWDSCNSNDEMVESVEPAPPSSILREGGPDAFETGLL